MSAWTRTDQQNPTEQDADGRELLWRDAEGNIDLGDWFRHDKKTWWMPIALPEPRSWWVVDAVKPTIFTTEREANDFRKGCADTVQTVEVREVIR